MWLGSHVAVAVMKAGSYSSDSPLAWELRMPQVRPKKTKKKGKKKLRLSLPLSMSVLGSDNPAGKSQLSASQLGHGRALGQTLLP